MKCENTMRDLVVSKLRDRLDLVTSEKSKALKEDMFEAYQLLHVLSIKLEQEIREYE